VQLLSTCAFATLLYASATTTLTKVDERKLVAFKVTRCRQETHHEMKQRTWTFFTTTSHTQTRA